MIFYTKSVGAIQSRNNQVWDFWWIFWELRRHFGSRLHIFISFFLHLKMIWKILHINIMMICTNGKKKSKFLEHFWAFRFQHFHFNVCAQYCQTEHLSSILSTMAFSQKLCNFVDLFFIEMQHKSPFISTVAIIKVIPHKWRIMLVTTTSQENKRNAQTPPVLYRLTIYAIKVS